MPKYPRAVEDFRFWAHSLELDNGDLWELEPYQLDVVRDILKGTQEVWLVVPEGNGKTTFMAGIALWHGLTVPYAEVPIAASTREQAQIMYKQAAGFIYRNKALHKDFKPQDGHRRIKCLKTGGTIQVYAADAGHGDGVIPTLALLDELHRHKNLDLYQTWRGKLEKRGGQICAISTAGEPSSDFEDTRDKIRKQADQVLNRGPYVRAKTKTIVLHDWAVRDYSKTSDLKVVAKANPMKRITAEVLRKRYESPTMTMEHWNRFACNIPTRISGQAITPQQWDALEEPGMIPEATAWSVAWLDLGWSIDTTAMGVLVWEGRFRRLITGVRIIQPPVQEDAIVEGLLDLYKEYRPVGVVYDPNAGGKQMAQLLEKGEHPLQPVYEAEPIEFFEHTQDNAPMSLAAARFDEALRNGWLRHDGHRGLRMHVLNAYRKPLGGEKWKYDRPPDAHGEKRKKYPIDALTGAIMGHSLAVTEQDTDDSEPLVMWR